MPVDGSFNFEPESDNRATYCFTVTVIGDDTIEQNETFAIVLTSSTGDNVKDNASQVDVTLLHDGDGENLQ